MKKALLVAIVALLGACDEGGGDSFGECRPENYEMSHSCGSFADDIQYECSDEPDETAFRACVQPIVDAWECDGLGCDLCAGHVIGSTIAGKYYGASPGPDLVYMFDDMNGF